MKIYYIELKCLLEVKIQYIMMNMLLIKIEINNFILRNKCKNIKYLLNK